MVRPTAAVLLIGSELLSGRTRDSNGWWLARRLTEAGWPCLEQRVVPDRPAAVVDATRQLAAPNRLVICSGGLGPTGDDLTRAALAEAARVELVEDAAMRRHIEDQLARRRRSMTQGDRRQALMPRGAHPLVNPVGSAPGFLLPLAGGWLAALPGVPAELEAMVPPLLDELTDLTDVPPRRPPLEILRLAGLREAEIQRRIEALDGLDGIELASYPHYGQITLQLTGAEPARLAAGADRVAEALEPAVFARDVTSLEQHIGRRLIEQQRTLALAESCTGGLLGQRLTDVPGSSKYLIGGFVAYSNRAKVELLGVPAALIETHGAVSRPVAEAMADGARRRLGTDLALAVTGVAGPDASEAKPPGTVHLALAGAGRTRARRLALSGSRQTIRQISATLALDLLRRVLEETK